MKLDQEIRNMFQQIVDSNGNFGDPIDTGTYNPFDMLTSPTLTDFQKIGVYIAILSHAMSEIDNTTHEDTLKGITGEKIKSVLQNRLNEMPTPIADAFKAFFVSEDAFVQSLRNIYKQFVLPNVS